MPKTDQTLSRMEEPLLSSREESVHLHEVAPGLIVYEHQHEDRQGSHWLQVVI